MVPPLHSASKVADVCATSVVPQAGWMSQLPPTSPGQPGTSGSKRRRSEIIHPDKKKKKSGRIARPPNSFMLFRQDFVANRPKDYITPERKCLSKQAGDAWGLLSSSERKKWIKKAHDASVEHARRNPGWQFKPAPRSKSGKGEKKSQSHKSEEFQASHVTSVTPTLLQNSIPPASLVHRKESLRFCSWDDSVLSPAPQSVGYADARHFGQLPESLRRRSSSVPVPEMQGLGSSMMSSFATQTHSLPLRPPSPSSIQHRLSYSGIRPGFVPIDIFAHSPQQQVQGAVFDDVPLQPLSSLRNDPPPSFEGYRIICPASPGEAHSAVELQAPNALYVSPFSQPQTGTNFGNWDINAHEPDHSRATADFDHLSPRTVPLDLFAAHGVNAGRSPFEEYPALAPTPTSEEQGQSPLITSQTEPDPLVERMRSIDFGTSHSHILNADRTGQFKPLTPPVEFFPLEMPISEFFTQYMPHYEGFQLPGLVNVHGAAPFVSAQDEETERQSSLGLSLQVDFPVDISMLNDGFVEMPCSGGASACGSGPRSSPATQQLLDFESMCGQ